MRIGLVCPYSLTFPGGVQGQVLGLARHLRAAGHDVSIVAPCDGPAPADHVIVIGESVPNQTNGSVAPIAPGPAAAARTIKALWDEKFDIVHVHEPLCPGPSATTVVMKPAPLVGTFHAAGDQPAYEKLSGMARWFAVRMEALVAVSKEAQALAGVAIPGPWTILFNGVDIDQFTSTDAALDLPDDRKSVLFVGRHEERKGLGVLLEAISMMPDDIAVWIAGDGPQTAELRARHRKDQRIVWLGRIDDAERNRRMAAASVFCAPSLRGESFGVILLEAMASGAPVVTSMINGYVGVAGPLDGRPAAAILSETGNARALADSLTRVLRDDDLAATLRAEGRLRAERFSMRRLAEAYLGIYEGVLALA